MLILFGCVCVYGCVNKINDFAFFKQSDMLSDLEILSHPFKEQIQPVVAQSNIFLTSLGRGGHLVFAL